MRSLALATLLLACVICMLACANAATKEPIAEGCGATSGVESDSGCICESCTSLKAQASFPLLSAQGYSLPHNWGRYDLSNITERFSNPQAQLLLFGNRSPNDIWNVVDAYAINVGIGALLFVGTLVSITLFIIFRCCCGCCGGHYPSPGPCCFRGMKEHETSYPPESKHSTRICMTIFSASVVSCFALAYFLGIQGLQRATISMTESPSNFAKLVRGMPEPVGLLVKDVVGGTISTAVVATTTELKKSVRTIELGGNLECLSEAVGSIPSPQALTDMIGGIQRSIELLPPTSKVLPILHGLNDTSFGFPSDADMLLQSIGTIITAKDEFTNTTALIASLRNTNHSSTTAVGTATQLSTTLKSFTSGLPKATAVGTLRTSISNLRTSGAKDSSVRHNVSPNLERTSWRSELQSNLTSLQSSILALPNASSIAAQMLSLNASLDSLSEDLGGLRTVLEKFEATRAGMPGGALVSSQIDSLVEHLNRLDINGTIDILKATREAINFLPDLGAVQTFVNGLEKPMQVGTTCVNGLVAEIERINATLVRLPSSIGSVLDMVQSVVGNSSGFSSILNGFDASFASVNASLQNLPAITPLLATAEAIGSQFGSFSGALNVSKVKEEVLGLDSASSAANLTSIISAIVDVQSVLDDSETRPSQDFVEQLRDLDAKLSTVPTQIQEALKGLTRWQSGMCTSLATNTMTDAGTVAEIGDPCVCSDMSQCDSGDFPNPWSDSNIVGNACGTGPGGMCNMQYASSWPGICSKICDTTNGRCAGNQFSFITCDPTVTNQDCSDITGAQCLTPDLSAVDTSLQGVQTSLQNQGDRSQLLSQVDQLVSDTSSMSFGSYISSVETMQSSSAGGPDLVPIKDAISSAKASVDSLPDFGALISQYNQVNATLSTFDASTFTSIETQLSQFDVSKDGSMLNQANSMLKAGAAVTSTLGNLLESNISSALGKMNAEKLQSAYNANGLAGQIDAILEGLDILVKASSPALDAFNSLQNNNYTLPDMNTLRETYIPSLQPLQVVTDADRVIEEKGPIAYLIGVGEAVMKAQQAQRSDNSSNSSSVGGVTLQDDAGSVFKNERMELRSSEGGQIVLCLTRSCLENTVNAAFEGSDLVPFMAKGSSPLPEGVGITLLLLVPWVLPLAVVLCGLCAAVGKGGLNGCGMCALLVTFIFLPWIFFFAGAIFFPSMIAFTDACVSAEAIGKMQLEQSAYFCPDGNYNAETGSCTVSFAIPSTTMPLTLDVNARNVYSGLFGGQCESSGVDSLWQSVGKQVSAELVKKIENVTSVGLENAALQTAIVDARSSLGANTEAFFLNAGAALSCRNVSSSYFAVKNGMCEGLLGSSFIIIAMWYLVGFLLAFVGVCVFAMSYKQFSDNPRLWRAQWQVEKREVPLVLNPEIGRDPPNINQVGIDDNQLNPVAVAVEAEVIIDLPPPTEHIVELELADLRPPSAEELGAGDAAAQTPAHARNSTVEIYDNPMQTKASSGSITSID